MDHHSDKTFSSRSTPAAFSMASLHSPSDGIFKSTSRASLTHIHPLAHPSWGPVRPAKGLLYQNHQLLHPLPNTTPPLTGSLTSSPRLHSSSQSLELSPSLLDWITTPETSTSLTHNGSTAVSMLNLLSFHDSGAARASYLRYGASFAKSVGSRRGGLAKVVGTVIPDPQQQKKHQAQDEGWDEIAVAHYPSIVHFGDMLAGKDYQDVNRRYRVGSLQDTAILCMSEAAVEGLWEKEQDGSEAVEKNKMTVNANL